MKRGQAGPPAPGGWGPTVVANPPPLRPPPPQTPPGLSSVHPSIYARAEIQQTPRGSGPGAPIPIAFTSAEVRAAVRFVLDFEPIPGLSSQPGGAHWIIAEKTAEVLGRWGNSRGWVRLRSSRGTSPRTFKLADKLYDISHGGRLTGNRPTSPPAGAVPIDLETATTTWDTEQFRSPEQDTGPAWFAPGVALAGDGPGGNPMLPWIGGVRPMPIGPGTQVTGARANLNALAYDAFDAAFTAGAPPYSDPYGYAAPFETAPPAYSEPLEAASPPPSLPPTSVVNFFPLVQAHPIKKKKKCNCPVATGCNC